MRTRWGGGADEDEERVLSTRRLGRRGVVLPSCLATLLPRPKHHDPKSGTVYGRQGRETTPHTLTHRNQKKGEDANMIPTPTF